jgi:hypothetical protein
LRKPPVPKPKLLNQVGLAAHLGVDRGTIWRWQDLELWGEGKGPPRVLIGKRYYYDPAAIQQWLRGLTAINPLAPARNPHGPR